MELIKKIHTFQSVRIPYYLSSETPEVLVAAGIHGDEYEVIDSVERALSRYHDDLPPVLFIPEVSPTSVAKRTRANCDGVDVNRHFFDESEVAEVKAIQTLLKPFHFTHAFTFHEDTKEERFYLYDTGSFSSSEILEKFKKALAKLEVKLFEGIDDPSDPVLGHEFKEGYGILPPGRHNQNNGPFEHWLINSVTSQRVMTPEIPGKISKGLKDDLVDAFFRHIVRQVVR